MMNVVCPFPVDEYPHIVLAHGGGGRMMKRLLDELVLPILEGDKTQQVPVQEDAAMFEVAGRVAMTTDSYVVNPLIFPGGDIGCLAINGTVNDLAMVGAVPQYLSVGLILEEGLPIEQLQLFLISMRIAADRAHVRIVTGDTKVVEHGKGDGLYINTSGVGFVAPHLSMGVHHIEPGDNIIVNGDLGRHGMAVLAQRDSLGFATGIESDTAPLTPQVQALLKAGIDVRCMRDITRGGLSSTLNELASAAKRSFKIVESSIPIHTELMSACELLGLDPLFVACEGRFIAIVPAAQTDQALSVLRATLPDLTPARIGEVKEKGIVPVSLFNAYGGQRVLAMLSGEQLPRIC